MSEKKKTTPSAEDMCTCGHVYHEHASLNDGGKCKGWRCVCDGFLDREEAKRALYLSEREKQS